MNQYQKPTTVLNRLVIERGVICSSDTSGVVSDKFEVSIDRQTGEAFGDQGTFTINSWTTEW